MMFSMMFSMLFMFQDKQLGLGMVRSTMTRLLALMAVLNRWKDARNTDIHLGDGVGVLLSYDGEGKQELKKKAPGLDISDSSFLTLFSDSLLPPFRSPSFTLVLSLLLSPHSFHFFFHPLLFTPHPCSDRDLGGNIWLMDFDGCSAATTATPTAKQGNLSKVLANLHQLTVLLSTVEQQLRDRAGAVLVARVKAWHAMEDKNKTNATKAVQTFASRVW
jgi:hypothetical protein